MTPAERRRLLAPQAADALISVASTFADDGAHGDRRALFDAALAYAAAVDGRASGSNRVTGRESVGADAAESLHHGSGA